MKHGLVSVSVLATGILACGGRAAAPSGAPDAGCHAALPSAPVGAPVGPSSQTVFAIRTVNFGETTGWQGLGLDIDGKDTTVMSTDVCQRLEGAPATEQVDGTCGVDNSFGLNLLPILQDAFGTGVAAIVSAAIEKGGATDLLVMEGVVTGADASGVVGYWLNGLPLGHPPRWDGTDAWPVDAASLQGGGPATAVISFPDGFRAGQQWVGEPSPGQGNVTFDGFGLPTRWPITHVSLVLAANGDGTLAGRLSGVIPTGAFLSLLEALADNPYCNAGGGGFSPQIEQASDILTDGSQDPSKPCAGISIGFAFTASPVMLGPVEPDPGLPVGCGDDGG